MLGLGAARCAPTTCGAAQLGPLRSVALLLKSWSVVVVPHTQDRHLDALGAVFTAVHRPQHGSLSRRIRGRGWAYTMRHGLRITAGAEFDVSVRMLSGLLVAGELLLLRRPVEVLVLWGPFCHH